MKPAKNTNINNNKIFQNFKPTYSEINHFVPRFSSISSTDFATYDYPNSKKNIIENEGIISLAQLKQQTATILIEIYTNIRNIPPVFAKENEEELKMNRRHEIYNRIVVKFGCHITFSS